MPSLTRWRAPFIIKFMAFMHACTHIGCVYSFSNSMNSVGGHSSEATVLKLQLIPYKFISFTKTLVVCLSQKKNISGIQCCFP